MSRENLSTFNLASSKSNDFDERNAIEKALIDLVDHLAVVVADRDWAKFIENNGVEDYVDGEKGDPDD